MNDSTVHYKTIRMENVNLENSQMATIFGKLMAGALLYESSEFKPENVKRTISRATKYIGKDHLQKLLNFPKENVHALAFACIDLAVIGKVTPETKELLKKLNAVDRVIIEVILIKLTGQDLTELHRERWTPALWKMKNMCQKYIELSPSEVKAEELAEAIKQISVPFIESVREHVVKMV